VQSRNKRSIALDLRERDGQDIARRLIAEADVLIENFRPGTLEGWGLSYEALSRDNPGLVMLRISGYGQSGPYRDLPGFGAIGEAMGGLRHLTGEPGRVPVRCGISIGDTLAALHGGEAFNVVPDLAVLRLNARVATAADADWLAARLGEIVAETDAADGLTAALHGGFHCPPKPFDEPTRDLFDRVRACGKLLDLTLTAEPTGGVCDGNKLAAAGLPTIDTLGVRGGRIHSPEEYLVVASLVERAKLTALVLADLADRGPPCS
jgi:hypothetical protein